MRKEQQPLNEIKLEVGNLVGKKMLAEINLGRSKIRTFNVEVLQAYPSVFVVGFEGENRQKTFSYNDILCGQIKFL